MTSSLLEDAFGHHVWATLRLIDTCLPLGQEQLETAAPGTFGSIIETMRHLVGADAAYLHALTAGKHPTSDADEMDLHALRQVMEGNRSEWSSLLSQDLDPDLMVVRYRDDGSESHAPLGIRLAQAIHHGTDHRSQICTALTTMSVQPPEIDVWDFADKDGRLTETPTVS